MSVPDLPRWCDGQPHSPTAIPPLPLHDDRWSGDDPYLECRRCGLIRDSRTGRVLVPGRTSASGDSGATP